MPSLLQAKTSVIATFHYTFVTRLKHYSKSSRLALDIDILPTSCIPNVFYSKKISTGTAYLFPLQCNHFKSSYISRNACPHPIHEHKFTAPRQSGQAAWSSLPSGLQPWPAVKGFEVLPLTRSFSTVHNSQPESVTSSDGNPTGATTRLGSGITSDSGICIPTGCGTGSKFGDGDFAKTTKTELQRVGNESSNEGALLRCQAVIQSLEELAAVEGDAREDQLMPLLERIKFLLGDMQLSDLSKLMTALSKVRDKVPTEATARVSEQMEACGAATLQALEHASTTGLSSAEVAASLVTMLPSIDTNSLRCAHALSLKAAHAIEMAGVPLLRDAKVYAKAIDTLGRLSTKPGSNMAAMRPAMLALGNAYAARIRSEPDSASLKETTKALVAFRWLDLREPEVLGSLSSHILALHERRVPEMYNHKATSNCLTSFARLGYFDKRLFNALGDVGSTLTMERHYVLRMLFAFSVARHAHEPFLQKACKFLSGEVARMNVADTSNTIQTLVPLISYIDNVQLAQEAYSLLLSCLRHLKSMEAAQQVPLWRHSRFVWLTRELLEKFQQPWAVLPLVPYIVDVSKTVLLKLVNKDLAAKMSVQSRGSRASDSPSGQQPSPLVGEVSGFEPSPVGSHTSTPSHLQPTASVQEAGSRQLPPSSGSESSTRPATSSAVHGPAVVNFQSDLDWDELCEFLWSLCRFHDNMCSHQKVVLQNYSASLSRRDAWKYGSRGSNRPDSDKKIELVSRQYRFERVALERSCIRLMAGLCDAGLADALSEMSRVDKVMGSVLRLNWYDEKLCQVVCEMLLSHMEDLPTVKISKLLYALAGMGHVDARLVAAVAKRLTVSPDVTTEEIVHTLLSAAMMANTQLGLPYRTNWLRARAYKAGTLSDTSSEDTEGVAVEQAAAGMEVEESAVAVAGRESKLQSVAMREVRASLIVDRSLEKGLSPADKSRVDPDLLSAMQVLADVATRVPVNAWLEEGILAMTGVADFYTYCTGSELALLRDLSRTSVDIPRESSSALPFFKLQEDMLSALSTLGYANVSVIWASSDALQSNILLLHGALARQQHDHSALPAQWSNNFKALPNQRPDAADIVIVTEASRQFMTRPAGVPTARAMLRHAVLAAHAGIVLVVPAALWQGKPVEHLTDHLREVLPPPPTKEATAQGQVGGRLEDPAGPNPPSTQ